MSVELTLPTSYTGITMAQLYCPAAPDFGMMAKPRGTNLGSQLHLVMVSPRK